MVPVPVHVPPTDNVDAAAVPVITPVEKLTFPTTERFPPAKFKVLPVPLKVKLLQVPVSPVDRVGQLVMPEAGITTLVDEFGTEPPHQLEPTFQSLLVVPVHVPIEVIVILPEVPDFVALDDVAVNVPIPAAPV